MKDTTLIRLIGLAAIQPIALAAALLTASTQAAPEHSGSLKDQASVTKLQEAGVPVLEVGKPQEPAAPATLPQPESEIIKLTHTYESSLRDLAEKAQQIVQGMPDKPDELSRNFGDLRNVLIDARTNLSAIIARKPEIDAQAKTVLKSAADVRQGFLDMANKIEDRLQQIRQKQTDNPKALEAAANALEGIKAACQRGESAVGPLRQLVLETHRQGQAVFAELELYPQIFDFAIETCDLYQKGIGQPASYAAVVEALSKARTNLRAIIESFIQAAQKAEETIKKIPQPGTASPIS
jgi:phage shock protein A